MNQLNQTLTKKIRVGDIDVGYRMFGNGDPLFLVMGFKGTMDMWDQRFLQNLASAYTVVIFDNITLKKVNYINIFKTQSF